MILYVFAERLVDGFEWWDCSFRSLNSEMSWSCLFFDLDLFDFEIERLDIDFDFDL